MLKIMYKVLIKLTIGIILLFGYNVFLKPFYVLIPINYITIIIAAFLDVPGIIGVLLLYMLNFQ